jgi:hypothetical protein
MNTATATPARTRTERRSWLRSNGIALAALCVLLPVAGWATTAIDYDEWRASEARDPITVADGGTRYADATWYPATVEVDPAPVRPGGVAVLPPNTVRVRVHLSLEVDDLAMLQWPELTPGVVEPARGVVGCAIALRAPDGRWWSASGDSDFADRPDDCSGGTDPRPAGYRPAEIAPYFVAPQPGRRFEVGAVFVVPREVAGQVEPAVTWLTRRPEYLRFPRR